MTTLRAPRHARLLLVDDDEEACRLLAEVLEREAYEVVPALSADEALAKVEKEKSQAGTAFSKYARAVE